MKAALYNGPGDLKVTEVPDPVRKPDNMILHIRACTICGTDLKLYTVGNARCKVPRVIGHELVGEIVHVGGQVEGFALGDRVTLATSISCHRCDYCSRGLENLCPWTKCISFDYDGAFAEFMEVPPEAIRVGNAIPVRPCITDRAAALSGPLSCVINAERIAGVKLGDRVVVLGAGPMGCLCAEVARVFGAHRVIITDCSPGRLALARKLPGVEVVDVSGVDSVEQIRAITDGGGRCCRGHGPLQHFTS
jgi:L-iditol 2-dehydrogenase